MNTKNPGAVLRNRPEIKAKEFEKELDKEIEEIAKKARKRKE